MLQVNQLSKAYRTGKETRSVLQNLSFSIEAGEVYGLLGANGAGKTTTINMICNLLQPDSGQIEVNGWPVSAKTQAIIGVAPQENLLYRSLTCRENLDFFARIYGLSRSQRRQQVQACLEAVSLQDRANSPVETLSGGMQRRLSVAIALVHQPKLVILDEPTTGLDIETRYEIWELIRRLKAQGITTLLTTHLLEEAERLCQRIGILKDGRLAAEGSLATLRSRIPAEEVVTVQTTNEALAIAQAEKHGFTPKRYGSDLAFWIPKPMELPELLHCFAGVPLEAISRQPIRLEHIYLEVTQTPGSKAASLH